MKERGVSGGGNWGCQDERICHILLFEVVERVSWHVMSCHGMHTRSDGTQNRGLS